MARAGQRIDKWLWYARIVKTRTLAGRLVSSRKVRLNRTRISKPSQIVRPTDILTFTLNRRVRILKIAALGVRRGPASEAQALYEDLSPQSEKAPHVAGVPPPAARPRGAGRPTKRERRHLDALRGQIPFRREY